MRAMISVARGLLGGFVIAGAISAGAMAGDAPDGHWRPPPVGTLLEYNYGGKCNVVAVDDDRYYCRGDRSYWVQDRSWSSYRGIFQEISGIDGTSYSFDERKLARLFPLKVGNKVTVNVRGGSYRVRTVYKVTSFKTVRTRLGPRPVFGISYFDTGDDGYKGKGWFYLDAELGFLHYGKHVAVSDDNKEYKFRLFNVELPAAGDGS